MQNLQKNSKGLFITFEGPEGSGKTTQIKLLKSYFESKGLKVTTTREPGGTKFGDKIRNLLLDHSGGNLESATELFLMLAQRTEHLAKVINPNRGPEQVVICDRYFDSSMAYQGYGRGIDPQKIENVHATFLPDFKPDITIVLAIDPAKGLERARHGGTKDLDRMESEALDFHKRVYKGYLKMAEAEPERFLLIKAEGTPEEIFDKIKTKLEQN